MRIGLLIPSTKGGGAEKFVDRLAKKLQEFHEVYVISYYGEETLKESLYKRINLDVSSKNLILKQILRTKKLKDIKVNYKLDICISFLENPNIINVFGRVKTCKTYLSVRNYKSKQLQSGKKGFIYKLLIKKMYNQADLIITNANKSAEDLIENFGIKKEKTKVIYNFYNNEEIIKLSNEPIELELESLFNKKIIMSFGRLEKVKGFEELILAYNDSIIDKNKVKLVIMGNGSLKTSLKKLIIELNLMDKVYLLDYRNNPYKYLRNSDVFVLNSYFEGFPNALVEAMICGTPVISTNCLSGPSEIIGNGDYKLSVSGVNKPKYGLLIPPPDEKGSRKNLITAMELILSSESLSSEFSNQARAKVKELDENSIIKAWNEIL